MPQIHRLRSLKPTVAIPDGASLDRISANFKFRDSHLQIDRDRPEPPLEKFLSKLALIELAKESYGIFMNFPH